MLEFIPDEYLDVSNWEKSTRFKTDDFCHCDDSCASQGFGDDSPDADEIIPVYHYKPYPDHSICFRCWFTYVPNNFPFPYCACTQIDDDIGLDPNDPDDQAIYLAWESNYKALWGNN